MFHLTKEGIPHGTIILGNRATWLDRHAAEELRSYVKKLSGAILIITHERYASSIEGGKILIGRASTSDIVGAFAAYYPDVLPEESDTENDCVAYAVRGDTLVISGSNDRSVYYRILLGPGCV